MADNYDALKPEPPRRFRKPKLPVRSLIPNMMTMLAICAGLTAIRLALEEHWEAAVAALVVAAVLDGLDGRMARLLRSATRFGAELDSLADVINFGVVPALVLYLWGLEDAGRLGWIAALLFAICCTLRLARFNTALDDPSPPEFADKYFVGLPAPAAAGIVLSPMIASFQYDLPMLQNAHFLSVWAIFSALLMVSTLPMYSIKRIHLRRESGLPILVAGAAIAALVVSYPWAALLTTAIVYLGLIPVSRRAYHRDMAAWRASQDETSSDKSELVDPE